MSRDWVVIANPVAGKGRRIRGLGATVDTLRRNGVNAEVVWTRAPGDGRARAYEVAERGYTSIAIAGGDGTANEVLNGLADTGRLSDFTITTLPFGTGNSFLRDFAMNDLHVAIDRIVRGDAQLCDLLRCTIQRDGVSTEHWVLNNITVGFGADVGALMNRRLKPLGHWGYSIGVFTEVIRLNPPVLSVTVDDTVHERRMTLLNIANSQYIGGTMHINPGALVDDGFLDVLLIDKLTRLELLRQFPLIFSGRHINHPKIVLTRATHCTVGALRPMPLLIDGEAIGTTPLSVQLVPNALRFVR